MIPSICDNRYHNMSTGEFQLWPGWKTFFFWGVRYLPYMPVTCPNGSFNCRMSVWCYLVDNVVILKFLFLNTCTMQWPSHRRRKKVVSPKLCGTTLSVYKFPTCLHNNEWWHHSALSLTSPWPQSEGSALVCCAVRICDCSGKYSE